MIKIKHLSRVMREALGYAWANKAWWLVPVIIVLLALLFLAMAGSGVAPFLYPRF